MLTRKKGRLKRLIDHLPVVVFEYTFFPGGNRDFTFISPHCEKLLGLKAEVIMNGQLAIHDFIHPDDWTTFDESIEESIRTHKGWTWQGRCKGKSGYLWLEAKSKPVKMKDGRTIYNGIFSDITEQKNIEQKQFETEQRYSDLIEQLPLGIAVQTKGKIRFANGAAARMMGAPNSEALVGQDGFKYVHPDFRAIVMERMRQVMMGKSTEPLEQKFIREDGGVIEVEVSGHPYLDNNEPAMQVIFTDITDRKKTEASFRKAETLFFQLFQNTPLAIVLLNEQGKVVQVNKGFEELFNYSLEEVMGNVLNQSIVPSELEPESDDINGLITENKVIRVETIRQRKDGKKLSVIIYGVPVLLQDQKIGIFGMYVDITERKKVEEELKTRNAELDNFVYKVSHDLRAPLSSVLGLVHLAGLPGNDDNLSDYIKLMGQKVEQLDHFISDVLSHSKNLKMEVKVEKVDFGKILEQTFSDLGYLKGAGTIRKELEISGDDFHSDPWRIAEIFRNLVSNAIKYRRLEEQDTFVRVKIETSPRQTLITFRDNGIGIEKNQLGRVFEMFYRASNQSEGSGLGLYIVKNAVDKLSGEVHVESEPNLGTTFRITLPNHPPSK